MTTHFIQFFLDWLGIEQKQQFVLFFLAYFVTFFIYALRQYRKSGMYSLLYMLWGLGLLLVLFIETSRGRWIGAFTFTASAIAAFAWYFAQRLEE